MNQKNRKTAHSYFRDSQLSFHLLRRQAGHKAASLKHTRAGIRDGVFSGFTNLRVSNSPVFTSFYH
jgi:hypothetical protein